MELARFKESSVRWKQSSAYGLCVYRHRIEFVVTCNTCVRMMYGGVTECSCVHMHLVTAAGTTSELVDVYIVCVFVFLHMHSKPYDHFSAEASRRATYNKLMEITAAQKLAGQLSQ